MSIFSFKQDVKLLNNNILVKGADSFACTLKKHGITTADIDWFLPHLSSCYFEERLYDVMKHGGMEVPRDKWFINLPRVGNVGAASAYLMLDELVRSGRLRRGDNIMLSVPESGRFAYSYVYLRVV
jgi:beta-ketoacyl-acyl-carrier-protein synthase III